jgi:hypothetical protein
MVFGSGKAAAKHQKPLPPYLDEHFAYFREIRPSSSNNFTGILLEDIMNHR